MFFDVHHKRDFFFIDENESIEEKSCVKTLSKIFLVRRDSSKFHCFIIQAPRSLNESFARLSQIGIVTLVIQSTYLGRNTASQKEIHPLIT